MERSVYPQLARLLLPPPLACYRMLCILCRGIGVGCQPRLMVVPTLRGAGLNASVVAAAPALQCTISAQMSTLPSLALVCEFPMRCCCPQNVCWLLLLHTCTHHHHVQTTHCFGAAAPTRARLHPPPALLPPPPALAGDAPSDSRSENALSAPCHSCDTKSALATLTSGICRCAQLRCLL
jgi:hypothetical protein